MIRTTPIPFLGECYADEARPFGSQDVCNWLPAPAEKGGTLTPEMGQTPPGLRPFVEVSGANATRAVRGTHNCEGKLFATIGNTLYQISNAGIAIPIGVVPGVSRVASAHNQVTNGNQLVVVNGSAGYVYDTPTEVYERITDDGYPGAITADFVDGYIVGIEPGRRFAFNSDLANAKAYNTLDRFTSEYRPDLLVTQVVSNNELILLSETSGEVFYNSGAAQQPFRTKRVFFDKGCSGRANAKVIDNSFVMHANDGMFYLYDNGTPKRISTRPIEQAVRGLNWRQAFCEVWVDGGHSVAYWTFPGGHTWGWDASSGKWHRRASYGMDRWRMNTLTRWSDEWVAGDFQLGRLWVVDWDYFYEGDQEFVSEITGVVISDSQNPLKMPRMEVLMDVGQEVTTPVDFPVQPEPPSITPVLGDGSVGLSWPGGTYAATGGTPPYSYSSRPGTIWPGDLGPMSVAGVVPSEIPDAAGPGLNIVRVTDSNGLFAEVSDPFNIGQTTAMLGVAASNFFLIGPGGTDWDNAYTYAGAAPALQAAGMIGGGGFWVNWSASGTDNPRYSTDATGTAWVTSAAAFDVNTRTPNGDYADGVFLIPATNGIYRSADHCISLTKVSTVPTYAIAMSDDYAVAIDASQTTCLVAPNPYTTFTAGVAHGVSLSSGSFIKKGGERFLVGGQVAPGGLPKAVFVNADGTGLAAITLPTLSIGYVSAAAYDPTGERWVIGTSAGQLCYMAESDGIWHLSASTLPGDFGVRSLEWNGAVFAGCGTDNAAASTDYVKHSTLGVTWILAPTLAAVRPAMIKVMR